MTPASAGFFFAGITGTQPEHACTHFARLGVQFRFCSAHFIQAHEAAQNCTNFKTLI